MNQESVTDLNTATQEDVDESRLKLASFEFTCQTRRWTVYWDNSDNPAAVPTTQLPAAQLPGNVAAGQRNNPDSTASRPHSSGRIATGRASRICLKGKMQYDFICSFAEK